MEKWFYPEVTEHDENYCDTAIVIPVWKPDSSLIEIVSRINRCGFRVIIVDDGNPAESGWLWAILEEKAAILHHDINRGKGEALKTAFRYIKNWCTDIKYIVTMDADGQHLISDMQSVLSEVKRCPGTLVLGVRSFEGEAPFGAGVENRVARFLFAGISGKVLQDVKTGLRGFDRSLLSRTLMIGGSRGNFEMNQLLEMHDENIEIRQVPVSTTYKSRIKRSGPFAIFRESLRIASVMMNYISSCILSYAAFLLLFMLLMVESPIIPYPLVTGSYIAGIVSMMFNYSLNSWRIHADKEEQSPLPGYVLTCSILLAVGTILLLAFTETGINVVGARILSDLITGMGYMIARFVTAAAEKRKDRASWSEIYGSEE